MRVFFCITKKCLPAVPRSLGIVITGFFFNVNHKIKMSTVNEGPFSLLYKDVGTASSDN